MASKLLSFLGLARGDDARASTAPVPYWIYSLGAFAGVLFNNLVLDGGLLMLVAVTTGFMLAAVGLYLLAKRSRSKPSAG